MNYLFNETNHHPLFLTKRGNAFVSGIAILIAALPEGFETRLLAAAGFRYRVVGCTPCCAASSVSLQMGTFVLLRGEYSHSETKAYILTVLRGCFGLIGLGLPSGSF